MMSRTPKNNLYRIFFGITTTFMCLSVHMTILHASTIQSEPVEATLEDACEDYCVEEPIPIPEDADTDEIHEYVSSKKDTEIKPRTATRTYAVSNSTLTKSGGVNYYKGWKETWYSSRVLYHYRTGEWQVDDYGVYRDSDGYVIVASTEPAGTVVETSFGLGKVYDSGCAVGVHDIYTNW